MKKAAAAKAGRILDIDGRSLTLAQIAAVAYSAPGEINVRLAKRAEGRVATARRFILQKVRSKEVIYGVNTGFGMLSNVRIGADKLDELQVNLIRSHCVGVGAPLSIAETRAAMLLRANTLAGGHSGVSIEVIKALLAMLNAGIHPVIPEQGSVGACGDLAPLAHMALALIGEGHVSYKGAVIEAAAALKKERLKPYKLQAKEGLSLINGTQIMTAVGALTLLKAKRLADLCDMAAAMTVEALKGSCSPFDADISRIRPHRGQGEVAARMRKILSHSPIMDSHANCGKVQDPYSLRCVPQVHGVARDVIRQAQKVLEIEINSVTDNPLVFADKKKIVSGGNFHGEYVGMALDHLAMAIQELASIAEQRIAKLVNPALSELPPFLAKDGGLNSGFMIVHVAAAALVSENKILCHPATIDSLPTSADKEDHVSMGTIAAMKCRKVLANAWNVLAMEFLCASQGLEFHRPLKAARAVDRAYRAIRGRVPPVDRDRAFYVDINAINQLMEKDIPA